MTVADLYQTNFAAGLLDDSMYSREETQVYRDGASKMENWQLRLPSGIHPRPGSKLIKKFTIDGRLIPFIFSDDQAYIVRFYSAGFEIHDRTDGSNVVTAAGLPWTLSDLDTLRYTQRGDVMVFAVGGKLFKNTRTGPAAFTLENPMTFAEASTGWPKHKPFFPFRDPGVMLSASATTGSVTLTTTAAYWSDPDHVGLIVRYRGVQIEITAVNSTTEAIGTVRESQLPAGANLDITTRQIDGITGNATAEDFEIGELVFGLQSGAQGYVREITDTDTLKLEMITGEFIDADPFELIEGTESKARAGVASAGYSEIAPIATDDWDEEAYSDYRGWPKAVQFDNARLWLAGSDSLPLTVFGSKAGDYFNFDAGRGEPSDAVANTISGDQVYDIRHIHDGRNLMFYTNKTEHYVPTRLGEGIDPGNFSPKKQSSFGIEESCRPIDYDAATTYVQKGGRVVREFLWDDVRGGYTSSPISILAGPFFSKAKELNVQYVDKDRTEQYLYVTGTDGDLGVYHSIRGEAISGWMHWTTNGTYESICVINDTVYALVKRVINSTTEYCLEEFDSDRLLDCEIEGLTPFTDNLWRGFANLAEQEVRVVAGKNGEVYAWDMEEYTVNASGEIDLSPYTEDDGIETVRAGFRFIADLRPMPVEIAAEGFSSRGRPKRIVSLTVGLNESLHITINGRELRPYIGTTDVWEPPPKFSGELEEWILGYDIQQIPVLTWERPLPCELTGLKVKADF